MRRFIKRILSWRHRRHDKRDNDLVEPARNTPAHSSQAPQEPNSQVQNKVKAPLPETLTPSSSKRSRKEDSGAKQKSVPLQTPPDGRTKAHSSREVPNESFTSTSSNIPTETRRFSSESWVRRKPIPTSNDQTIDTRNSTNETPSISSIEALLSTSTISNIPHRSKQPEEPTHAETLLAPKQHHDPRTRADSGPGGNIPNRKLKMNATDPSQPSLEAIEGGPRPHDTHGQMSPIVEQPIDWDNEDILGPNVSSDTDIDTTQAPAVTHEMVHRHIHEERTDLITREIHNYDIMEHILPVVETEVLPAKHFVLDERGNKVEVDERHLPDYWQNWDSHRKIAGRTLEPTAT